MDYPLWLWVSFLGAVLAMLALDLGVFHRRAHAVSIKEATIWTVVWVVLSLLFNAWLWYWKGSEVGLQFLTGYLIEKSLSVDNIFVFVLLFSFFRVPAAYQHRVLFWGVLGALIMRGAMIGLGAALIERFEWIIYIFGVFLIFTGIRMGFAKEEEEIHPEGNALVRMVRRFVPVTRELRGEHFFVRESGRLFATPLFIVLLIVESTDLIFAVDSIPAIFAVTTEPFLVFSSNVCAILGLRALYFLLAGVMAQFYYLKLGLAAILTFVGVKMLMPEISYLITGVHYKIPTAISLSVIVTLLGIAVAASMFRARRLERSAARSAAQPAEHKGEEVGV